MWNKEKNRREMQPIQQKVSSKSRIFLGLVTSSTMNRVSMVLDCCGVDHESLPKTTSLLPSVENKLMIRADQSCSDARNGMSGFYSN